MTIEKSPAAANHSKASGTAASHGARAKTDAGDAGAGGAGGGGFMAILGALGEAAADAPGQALVPDAATDVPTTAAPFDASTLLQNNPQIAAAAQDASVFAQQATALVRDPAALAPSAAELASDPAAMAQQAALLSATQPLPAAPVAAAGPVPGQAPAPKGLAALGEGAGKAAAATAAAPGLEVAESSTHSLQQAHVHTKAGKAALPPGADSSAPGNSSAAAGSERVEPHKFMAALEQARDPAGGRTLEPLLAPLLARQEKPQGERKGNAFQNVEPTYSGTALGVSAPDFSQPGAGAPVLAPEMQVAEQVSYWVSQNVQNAELKLDGLGQSPVEVSISLQGNEAQISFRTDEAATRDVLQGAGAQLKEMLLREGLVLTGVSVGGSGSGQADGGQRRDRQTARQGVTAPLQVARAETGVNLRGNRTGGAGRSVDLFV
ncbi:flagellar hook-length control protein FliK [Rhodoferax lacus]|nr:flagellar hook-length control protein FliK [Rhodoferax lacus]